MNNRLRIRVFIRSFSSRASLPLHLISRLITDANSDHPSRMTDLLARSKLGKELEPGVYQATYVN